MTHQPDIRIHDFFKQRAEIIATIPDELIVEFRHALEDFYVEAFGDGCDSTIGDYRYAGR